MTRVMNIVLLVVLVVGSYAWRQDVSRMEYALSQAEYEKRSMRLELEKTRDESSLLQAVVWANLSRIADPAPNKVLTVTAYSTLELIQDGQDEPMLTASMSKPKEGGVAVSRDLFKQGWVFGKKVYIKNHGVFTITDIMGESRHKSVDIFMDDHGQAVRFGKKRIEVVLLDV